MLVNTLMEVIVVAFLCHQFSSVQYSRSVVPDSLRPHESQHARPPCPSMGFSQQGYWSGSPFPSPGDLTNPGIESRSPALLVDALPSEPPGKPLTRND